MGLQIVTAPVLLVLSCGHEDTCPEELRITLDTALEPHYAVEEGVKTARTQGWTVEEGPSVRFLPKVYCLAHTPGEFRRGVLGMWDGE